MKPTASGKFIEDKYNITRQGIKICYLILSQHELISIYSLSHYE